MALFISFQCLGAWKKELEAHLPESVQSLKPGQTTKSKATELLGKPDLSKNGKDYWEMEGFKYALELTYQDGKIRSIHYNFKQGPLLKDLPSLDEGMFKANPQSSVERIYSGKGFNITYSLSTGRITSYSEVKK